MRTTKRMMLSAISEALGPKMIANNTMKYSRLDGTEVIRLHNTDIIEVSRNGDVTLNTKGWQTHTTKERFNEYVPRYIPGFRVWQEAGIWSFRVPGNVYIYFDGVKISKEGKVLNPPREDIEAKTKALRKQIKEFAKLVLSVDTLPLPNNGDCWLCCMRDASGRTMGEGDTGHLLEHVKEKYLHGSLLVNAMRFRGFTDEQIRLHYSMDFRDTFQRALRSYLYRKLGLAA